MCCVLQLLQQAELLRHTVNHHVYVKLQELKKQTKTPPPPPPKKTTPPQQLQELDEMRGRMDKKLSLETFT